MGIHAGNPFATGKTKVPKPEGFIKSGITALCKINPKQSSQTNPVNAEPGTGNKSTNCSNVFANWPLCESSKS